MPFVCLFFFLSCNQAQFASPRNCCLPRPQSSSLRSLREEDKHIFHSFILPPVSQQYDNLSTAFVPRFAGETVDLVCTNNHPIQQFLSNFRTEKAAGNRARKPLSSHHWCPKLTLFSGDRLSPQYQTSLSIIKCAHERLLTHQTSFRVLASSTAARPVPSRIARSCDNPGGLACI